MGDALAAELDELRLAGGVAGLQGDERLRALSPLLVGDGDDRALHHRRVLSHALLDLDRRDVLPARDDDVLLPIAELDVPVGVPDGEVAGVEPAAPEGLRGRVGLLEVALHDVVAAHHDLAQRLPVHGDVLHPVVHDPHEVGHHVALALAGGEPGLLFHGLGVPLPVPRAHRVGPVGLGQAVDVDGAEAQLLEPPEQRGRGWCPRDRHRHRLREPVGLRVVDDPDLDGGRAAVVGHALLVDEVPDPPRLHPAEADVGAGERGDAPGEAPAVAVEHGERPEIAALERHPRLDRLAQGVQVGAPVMDHDALRAPRRPRGVVDRDRLVLVVQPGLAGVGRAAGEELLVRVTGRARVVDSHHAERVQIQRLEEPLELVIDQEHPRAGVPEDVAHLVAGEPRVDGDEDQARGGHAEVRLEHGRRVGGDDGDPVQLPEAERAQGRGEPVRPSLELAIGVAPGAVDHRRLLGEHVGAPPEKRDRGQLGPVGLPLGGDADDARTTVAARRVRARIQGPSTHRSAPPPGSPRVS